MKDERSTNNVYAASAFLLWPFLSAVAAVKNYNRPWAKNLFWAFCAFYGFAFAIGAESQGSDIVRYVAEFQALYGVPMTFSKAIDYFMYSGEIDVLRTFIAITLSRFTDSQAILTLVYGTIFGYFFSRNIWYVLERLEGKIQPITILLLICFFLVVPIWNINGFRMWTAAHVFLFGLLPYLCEGKKKGLWIACSSMLVHFAFLVPVGVLLGYVFLGNRLTLYFIFYLATFFISEINMTVFNNIIEGYMPEIFQERTSYYRSETAVEKKGSGSSQRVWYARWYGRALSYAVMGFLVVLYLKGRKFIKNHDSWLRLFSFVLLFYGAANILSLVPSGSRYISVVNLSALALIIWYVQNLPQERVMKRFIILATPALLLFAIVSLRIGLYSLSATAILGNPIIAFFMMGENFSMNDFLRMLI